MSVSKTGLSSLLVGLVILALTWFFYFSTAGGLIAMVMTTVMGGVVLLGLFFALIGALMIII